MSELDFQIPPEYYRYYVMTGIVLAAVWCFFGYRIFRFVLGLLGFILGAVAAGAIGYELSEGRELIAIASAVVGGLLGAGVMFVLYLLGVFLIGAVLGAIIALSVFYYLSQDPEYLTIIITAAVTGIIAVFIKRFMIILATSFTGAWAVVTGFTYFLKDGFDPFEPRSVFSMGEDQIYRFLIVWFGLSVAGFTVQYITSAKDYKPEPEAEEEESESEDKEVIELDEPYIHPASDSPSDPEDKRKE